MANWHYYSESGEKIGPVRGRELKRLVEQGTITQETVVEDDNGRTALAKNVKGLTFPEMVQPEPNPFVTVPPVTDNPFASPSSFAPPIQEVPLPPPVDLFCTNCGNTVSAQSIACMSCGARPTGHKKFCRQCGVELKPEQVVCVKCGAGLTGGLSGVGDAISSAFQSTEFSSSIAHRINSLPKPIVIVGGSFIALCLLLFLVGNVRTMEFLPKLTPAEKMEVDKILADVGRNAIVYYLESQRDQRAPDMNRILKYLKHFVSKGADVNAESRDGYKPLRLLLSLHIDENDTKNAIKFGEIIGFLLLHGADVNTTDGAGNTLLHLAARSGDVTMAKLLMAKGANIDVKGSGGWTPLHHAVAERQVVMVKFLISQGADVNNKAENNMTPIMLATFGGGDKREEMTKILESAGATKFDIMPPSNAPSTPRPRGGLRGQQPAPSGR